MKTTESLAQHLSKEHGRAGIFEYLREVVYGGLDGIITTFAVVAGFAGATAEGAIAGVGVAAVVLFGLANLFADGVSMGLGNFLSLRSAADQYRYHRHKEEAEIRHSPQCEREETIQILRERGINAADAAAFADLYQRHPRFWADFMMDYELEMERPDPSPAAKGLATFCAFVVFGAVPLLPYLLPSAVAAPSFPAAVAATAAALLALGALRSVATREHWLRCLSETLAVGAASAIVAYAVGALVGGL